MRVPSGIVMLVNTRRICRFISSVLRSLLSGYMSDRSYQQISDTGLLITLYRRGVNSIVWGSSTIKKVRFPKPCPGNTFKYSFFPIYTPG